MRESDYILATNLARIRAARSILREVTNLSVTEHSELRIASGHLSAIEDKLSDRVEKAMRGKE